MVPVFRKNTMGACRVTDLTKRGRDAAQTTTVTLPARQTQPSASGCAAAFDGGRCDGRRASVVEARTLSRQPFTEGRGGPRFVPVSALRQRTSQFSPRNDLKDARCCDACRPSRADMNRTLTTLGATQLVADHTPETEDTAISHGGCMWLINTALSSAMMTRTSRRRLRRPTCTPPERGGRRHRHWRGRLLCGD